jgi:hypothetical protein
MQTMLTNVCPRCGKLRITSRKWTEVVTTMRGNSTIGYEDTICPDRACQRKVEEGLVMAREKHEEILRNRELMRKK